MTVKDRILQFCNAVGVRPGRFERECGLSNGYLSKLRNEPSRDKIGIIASTYPNLNIDWLLTGEGNMLKEPDDAGGRRSVPSPADDGYRLVPMYNIDARGGFGTNDEVDGAEYIVDYVPFKDAKMDDICVPVVGNSMAPTYVSGSIVLLHRIERWREFLELGQVYIIV